MGTPEEARSDEPEVIEVSESDYPLIIARVLHNLKMFGKDHLGSVDNELTSVIFTAIVGAREGIKAGIHLGSKGYVDKLANIKDPSTCVLKLQLEDQDYTEVDPDVVLERRKNLTQELAMLLGEDRLQVRATLKDATQHGVEGMMPKTEEG